MALNLGALKKLYTETGLAERLQQGLEDLPKKLDPFNLPLECRKVVRRDSDQGCWRAVYILPNDYTLTLNDRKNYTLDIAYWEVCVFNEKGDYAGDTPLGKDAQVFLSDEQASEFIHRAIKLASWRS